MSELRAVDHAEHSPCSCVRCSTATGPFVDFGLLLDPHGQLYLCFGCIFQIADLAGCLPPEGLARFEALLTDSLERENELREQLKDARRTFVQRVSEVLIEDEAQPVAPAEVRS